MISRKLYPLIAAVLGLMICSCSKTATDDAANPYPSEEESAPVTKMADNHLRYLAINAGNASPQFGCWESKLCREQDVKSLREYISKWKPDVIMISEVYSEGQLTGTEENGPILPSGYTGMCCESRDRNTDAPAEFDAKNASHQHECIAWNDKRMNYVEDSALSAYGRNDAYGKKNCNYDFTGFRVQLYLNAGEGEKETVTAVSVHPDSGKADCRKEEISRYWSQLATGQKTVIGGDWNTDKDEEIQCPDSFEINYLRGKHWNLADHEDEYSAQYLLGINRKLDHAFSNFGKPCTSCGKYYGTPDLKYGSALGSYDGHPRADGGEGMDHRQILVDILF